MKILILKQLVPVAAFGAAMAGAFGTNTVERNQRTMAPVAAFEKINLAGACGDIQHTCETTNVGPLCTNSIGTQLWAKDANNRCTVQVYMEPQ